MRKNRKQGFIALISAIVISAILLIVAITMSYSAFFVRYAILDSEYKNRSSALAEGCVDSALLKLANGSVPASNEIIIIGSDPDDKCTIISVDQSGGYTIKTQAIFRYSFTNLVITTDANLAVLSWEEVPKSP